MLQRNLAFSIDEDNQILEVYDGSEKIAEEIIPFIEVSEINGEYIFSHNIIDAITTEAGIIITFEDQNGITNNVSVPYLVSDTAELPNEENIVIDINQALLLNSIHPLLQYTNLQNKEDAALISKSKNLINSVQEFYSSKENSTAPRLLKEVMDLASKNSSLTQLKETQDKIERVQRLKEMAFDTLNKFKKSPTQSAKKQALDKINEFFSEETHVELCKEAFALEIESVNVLPDTPFYKLKDDISEIMDKEDYFNYKDTLQEILSSPEFKNSLSKEEKNNINTIIMKSKGQINKYYLGKIREVISNYKGQYKEIEELYSHTDKTIPLKDFISKNSTNETDKLKILFDLGFIEDNVQEIDAFIARYRTLDIFTLSKNEIDQDKAKVNGFLSGNVSENAIYASKLKEIEKTLHITEEIDELIASDSSTCDSYSDLALEFSHHLYFPNLKNNLNSKIGECCCEIYFKKFQDHSLSAESAISMIEGTAYSNKEKYIGKILSIKYYSALKEAIESSALDNDNLIFTKAQSYNSEDFTSDEILKMARELTLENQSIAEKKEYFNTLFFVLENIGTDVAPFVFTTNKDNLTATINDMEVIAKERTVKHKEELKRRLEILEAKNPKNKLLVQAKQALSEEHFADIYFSFLDKVDTEILQYDLNTRKELLKDLIKKAKLLKINTDSYFVIDDIHALDRSISSIKGEIYLAEVKEKRELEKFTGPLTKEIFEAKKIMNDSSIAISKKEFFGIILRAESILDTKDKDQLSKFTNLLCEKRETIITRNLVYIEERDKLLAEGKSSTLPEKTMASSGNKNMFKIERNKKGKSKSIPMSLKITRDTTSEEKPAEIIDKEIEAVEEISESIKAHKKEHIVQNKGRNTTKKRIEVDATGIQQREKMEDRAKGQNNSLSDLVSKYYNDDNPDSDYGQAVEKPHTSPDLEAAQSQEIEVKVNENPSATPLEKSEVNAAAVEKVETIEEYQENKDSTGPLTISSIKDIQSNAPFVPALGKCLEVGLISLYPDLTFRPNDLIERKHIFKVIGEIIENDEPGIKLKATDIAPNNIFYKGFETAVTYSLVEDENARLDEPLSREDLMAIYTEVSEIDLISDEGEADRILSTFEDGLRVKPRNRQQIATLLRKGTIKGVNGKLNLTSPATRAEFVNVVSQMI